MVIAAGLAAFSAPAAAQLFGGGKSDAETNVRLNDVEDNMRRLTGQVEELSNQIRVLQDQIRRMQEDNEYRLQQLEAGGGGTGKRSDAAPATTGSAPQAQGGSAQLGAPPSTLGTLDGSYGAAGAPEGSGDAEFGQAGGYENGSGPLDLSALARGGEATRGTDGGEGAAPPGVRGAENAGSDPIGNQVAAADPLGDPRVAYDDAYRLMLSGDYPAAQAGFGLFLTDFPDHELAGNAQFWLGETYYAQRRYRDAADAFLKSYTDYPGSSKVTDSLLKLGLSLKGIGERDAACATFSELLSKYPSAPAAVRSEAQAEQQRAGCS
ncbi:tol-pal system protein YbgF [Stappia sp. F7233]|uniref:Cell division coordinator CpoB n=2 Tax=Stappia albiluteola TaxID=2758565 RepID=A0A839AFC2_9HYPH|nr:tol-pal system protein YbgF [Stappia albiluteola]